MTPIKPRRCPECRSLPIRYIEIWSGHSIEFEVDDEGFADGEGILDEGDATHVVAECKCGNKWRLRGVLQITGLQRTGAPK